MPENVHDQILVEGLKEGNERIFDYLFQYYYSGLVVYASQIVHDQQISEDLVQDFFVKLWTSREYLTINKSIKSYFFTSIKNLCFDYLRHLQVKQKAEKTIYSEKSVETISSWTEPELEQRIQRAIDRLPPVCRKVFVMNRFEGMKPVEIAKLKGISVRTVETHIGKALRLLRKELAEFLPIALFPVIIKTFFTNFF